MKEDLTEANLIYPSAILELTASQSSVVILGATGAHCSTPAHCGLEFSVLLDCSTAAHCWLEFSVLLKFYFL